MERKKTLKLQTDVNVVMFSYALVNVFRFTILIIGFNSVLLAIIIHSRT